MPDPNFWQQEAERLTARVVELEAALSDVWREADERLQEALRRERLIWRSMEMQFRKFVEQVAKGEALKPPRPLAISLTKEQAEEFARAMNRGLITREEAVQQDKEAWQDLLRQRPE